MESASVLRDGNNVCVRFVMKRCEPASCFSLLDVMLNHIKPLLLIDSQQLT